MMTKKKYRIIHSIKSCGELANNSTEGTRNCPLGPLLPNLCIGVVHILRNQLRGGGGGGGGGFSNDYASVILTQ